MRTAGSSSRGADGGACQLGISGTASTRYSRAGHELSATLRRSCQEAQDTFTTARDSAVRAYGETDQADRAAFTVLKEKFEKRGDHWIAKRDPGD
jgi:hypothetical protein